MIHLEVGPAPDEFLNGALRRGELDAIRAWLSYPPDMRPLAPATAGRHRNMPSLMGMLEVGFAHKCAFCETGIPPGKGEIMFYRPVGSPGVKTDSSKSYYYPWLAWDWSNIYLACRDCVELREAGFKVKTKAIPDVIHLEQENAIPYYQVEEPYLLDPWIDIPIAFLQFTENGDITARDEAERGRYTIRNLKLNRSFLVQKRKQEAQDFKRLWLEARMASLENPTTIAPSLVELVGRLAARCQHGTPFAGMKAYLLLEWLTGETKIALDSAGFFAAAIQREPWLQVYQSAMETLGLEKPSDARMQVSADKPTQATPTHTDSGSTQANVTYIYIKGDMYQIGSISGGQIAVGRKATTPNAE